jgi:hypothetical protein
MHSPVLARMRTARESPKLPTVIRHLRPDPLPADELEVESAAAAADPLAEATGGAEPDASVDDAAGAAADPLAGAAGAEPEASAGAFCAEASAFASVSFALAGAVEAGDGAGAAALALALVDGPAAGAGVPVALNSGSTTANTHVDPCVRSSFLLAVHRGGDHQKSECSRMRESARPNEESKGRVNSNQRMCEGSEAGACSAHGTLRGIPGRL